MGVPLSSAAHVLDVLASVQPREPSSAASSAASSSDREILVQDLLQYLFLQTYARPHAQSLLRESTAQEVPSQTRSTPPRSSARPSPGPVPSPGPRSPAAATGASSPGAGTSPKGSPAKPRTASREWQRAEAEALQAQFVVHHFSALCGLLVEDEAKIGTGGQGGGLLELTARRIGSRFCFRQARGRLRRRHQGCPLGRRRRQPSPDVQRRHGTLRGRHAGGPFPRSRFGIGSREPRGGEGARRRPPVRFAGRCGGGGDGGGGARWHPHASFRGD